MGDIEKDNIDDLNLEELNKNINIKLDVFGEIELRYILNGDLPDFHKFLKDINDEKEFCAQIIYHQLVLPKISFSEFNEISDKELKVVADKFVKFEFQIFKYFKEDEDIEFFTNFRSALESYFKIKKIRNSRLTSLESTIENLYFQLSNIPDFSYLEQHVDNIKLAAQAPNIDSINSLINQLSNLLPNFSYIESLIKQYPLDSTSLESILNQTRSLMKWVESNRNIFEVYNHYWQEMRELFENPEENAANILNKYKWFITPSLPHDFVLEVLVTYGSTANPKSGIDKLFIEYFSSNNYENLENLVENWSDIDIFKPRMNIFRNCISILKNSNKDVNPSIVIIPTLITQIDGILTDFMKKTDLYYDTDNKCWRYKNNGKGTNWKEFFKNQTLDDDPLNLANEILLNILFQKSIKGLPLENPFTFNRHKILHGEELNYGRKDNTIRTFLILDFLAVLMKQKTESNF